MSEITQQELKKNIKEKKFAPVYFFFGQESFLIDSYTNSIINANVDKSFQDFDLKILEYKNSSVDEIYSACESFPMMSERKCVIVKDYDAEGAKANEVKKMEQLLSNHIDSTILIFKNNSIEVNLKRSAKWKKFVSLIDKSGNWSEFGYRDISSLAKYLVGYATKLNCAISMSDAQYLISITSSNIAILNNEMDKLCAYVMTKAENHTITRLEIDKIAIKTVETNVFKLTDCLLSGQYDKAYSILDLLFYQREQPTTIVFNIANCYIDLYRAKSAIESGASLNDMVKMFEYKSLSWKFERAMRDCKRVTLQQLRICLNYIEETEIKLKSTQQNGRVAIEELIAKMLLTLTAR